MLARQGRLVCKHSYKRIIIRSAIYERGLFVCDRTQDRYLKPLKTPPHSLTVSRRENVTKTLNATHPVKVDKCSLSLQLFGLNDEQLVNVNFVIPCSVEDVDERLR